MLTSWHLVENAPGKINLFIKSTISLKHDDWFFYSALFTQLKKLTYKIIQPILITSG